MVARKMGQHSEAVARRIRMFRLDKGLSQEQLERKAGLGSGTITKIENGTRGIAISIDVVVEIARALEVPLIALVYGAQRPSRQH